MRLIDADALINDAFDLISREELREDVPQIIKDYCDAQPTVDAVPVVRCEQCTWWNMGECMFWAGDGMYTKDHDYCSRGKRKEE